MNRYEELAVAQDVSLEEIHQAYQALARLLHPDNQSDPKLKSAAERQMIRLNEILVHEARGSRSSPPPQPIPMLPLKRQLPLVFAIQRGRRSSSPETFCPIRSKQSLLRPHHLQVETGHPRDH